MGWAAYLIVELKAGRTVQFRPRGNSMTGRVNSGQLVTVAPLNGCGEEPLKKGDIVLCKVNGNEYLHLVGAVNSSDRFQICNNHGRINGWIGLAQIFGKCVAVEN